MGRHLFLTSQQALDMGICEGNNRKIWVFMPRLAQRILSMRVLPRVLGFTLSRSKNSAIPSSYERNSCWYTSGSTGAPCISLNPCLPKNSVSKVKQKSLFKPRDFALSIIAVSIWWPILLPRNSSFTATVRTSPRSSHNTWSAPQPIMAPSFSATKNSWTYSYNMTVSLESKRRLSE